MMEFTMSMSVGSRAYLAGDSSRLSRKGKPGPLSAPYLLENLGFSAGWTGIWRRSAPKQKGRFRGLFFIWSERRDLNSRPLPPQGSALPSCATSRTRGYYTRFPKDIHSHLPSGREEEKDAPSLAEVEEGRWASLVTGTPPFVKTKRGSAPAEGPMNEMASTPL